MVGHPPGRPTPRNPNTHRHGPSHVPAHPPGYRPPCPPGTRPQGGLPDLPGHQAKGHTGLGWKVADITGTVRALAAKGVKFNVYDGFGQDADGIWGSPGGGARVAWFNDPDGNVLSLTQVG